MSVDPTTKKRGRSKLFACFKPVVVDGDHESVADDQSGRRLKKRDSRSFTVAMKAALFKASPLKRSRSESAKHDFYRLTSSLHLKSKKLVGSMKKSLSYPSFWASVDSLRTSSSTRSSLCSSTSSSSRRTNSSSVLSSPRASSTTSPASSRLEPALSVRRSAPLDFRQTSPPPSMIKPMIRKNVGSSKSCVRNPILEMCVFLACLIALVFWGKAFAIMTCTSTWLLFRPGCHGRMGRANDSPENDIFDTDEHKKRVIMKGLLERNRPRGL
ncbi:hypothetical protein Salat_2020000 [Sesamum alatum]|uniref:Uncharacterized protein n=1 Tax=Sesamum alatum TaxID=300844 RepID=A0AAE2CG05_9LAMI|nr:hypothetical protein Salat_2020000 [Sesamum alatum]